MKKTVLYSSHEVLGAKLVEFAGYSMPVQYAGIVQEHQAVRESAGLFDVSHMGEFFISGKDSVEFLQYVCANDISKLKLGKAQYNYLPNEKGGVVDDLIVYQLEEQSFMLVVNASNIDKDFRWLQEVATTKKYEVNLENKSEEYALLALQGPKSVEVLSKLTEVSVGEIPFYHFEIGKIGKLDNIIISATGYTGSGGFELYVKNEQATELWHTILQDKWVQPVGLGARDTLRLEMGYCLYGHEISEETSPLEAGLGWVTKLETNFLGSDMLKAQKEKGLTKKLVPILVQEKGGIPRQGYELENENGETIGEVTSGTSSPTTKQAIAMAFVQKDYAKPGTQMYLLVRKKKLKAIVVKLPFVEVK